MILITNRVKSSDATRDKRISQAGQNYQDKLSEFINPSYELSFMPSFIEWNYKNTSSSTHFYINSFHNSNFSIKIFKYIVDSLKAFLFVSKLSDRRILIYNLDLHNIVFVMLTMLFSKKKQYMVVADYAIYSNKLINIIFESVYRRLDGVIALNSNIKVNKNTKVLLGLIRDNEIHSKKNRLLSNKLLFSGSIGKTTGINLCLDTFSDIDNKNLIITGKPYHFTEDELDKLIDKYRDFKNIRYKGLLDLQSYKNELAMCDIAFSLRNPNDVEHEYNFPSKILEYLSKGIFVISTKKYRDIPDDILFYCDYNKESLKNSIMNIYKMSQAEICSKRLKIKTFVENNFSCNKLLERIRELDGNY